MAVNTKYFKWKEFKDEKLIRIWMKFVPQDGVPIGNMLSGVSGLFFLTDFR